MGGGADADRAAILRVIEEETTAYFAKDFERWAACWVHAPHARRLGWYARGGRMAHVGWDEEAAEMRLSMEQFPTPNPSVKEVRRENISVRVGGDLAWVTFDQSAPSTGDPFDVPGVQQEMRVLERHDGEWRIAGCFVIGSTLEFVTSPLLRVDERSAIVWMNAAAEAGLKSHPGLMLGAGRLRGRARAADERLQASIRWAAGLKGYAARQAARSVVPALHGTLPVVLGESGEGVLDICWVSAEGGMILVSFNDQRATEQRLEAAAVVYGLTPAQLRLVRLIVAGRDMVEAASDLGISVTTARTQLKRMFDKVGVSSQASLVRALLSVASPVG